MNIKPANLFLLSAAALTLSAALTACGGGSDASEDVATDSASPDGTISKQCNGNSSTAQVTTDGCIANLGGSIETLACTGPNTVYRLAGTNHTLDAVLKSNQSYTAGGTITINGVKIQCVS